MRIHEFKVPVSNIPLPEKFTFPFHYTPHPLCEIAADEVRRYLLTRKDWAEELQRGKMFGVLVVQTSEGETGFLAAFSGNLAHNNNHPYFVPPVFDFLSPTGFFRVEEEHISSINRKIQEIERNPRFIELLTQLAEASATASEKIRIAKQALKEAKQQRELKRSEILDSEENQRMIRESQFQKAELKRLEKRLEESVLVLQTEVDFFRNEIALLKQERKNRSADLQQQLFDTFRFLNAEGVEKSLCSIFQSTSRQTPPAGAGECAGPKLLQYAYTHGLRPICMAEFWWGDSPKTEIRRHGHYYPACKGKCEPILTHMLKGLNVDDNPLDNNMHHDTELEILFEDEWLIAVNKPAGMLSVPGKGEQSSVFSHLRSRFPLAEGPMIVHRLDMATSGVLLLAKTKDAHKQLQAQFKHRSVKKRYIALLDGIISDTDGIIELPLAPDILDRPRQMVSVEHGKPAVTRFHVSKIHEGKTRIEFYPITGRTHQLRIHSAHILGLNTPIVGDELYGHKNKRMFLHAEMLEFDHPVTHQRIHIEKKADF